MVTAEQRRFVRLVAGWSLAVVVGLSAAGMLSPAHWLVATVLGFLALVQITASRFVVPPWRRRLRLPIVAGIGLFCLAAGYELAARAGLV